MNPYKPDAGGYEYMVVRFGTNSRVDYQEATTKALNTYAKLGFRVHSFVSYDSGLIYTLEREAR